MPFSAETPAIQQHRFSFISARWLQLNTLGKEWTDKAVNFLTLTNAGGAVAVLSFMGASDAVRAMSWPRIALCCFALGVVCTGVLIAKQFRRMDNMLNQYRIDSERYLFDQIEWDTLTTRDDDRSKTSFMDYFWGYAGLCAFHFVCPWLSVRCGQFVCSARMSA